MLTAADTQSAERGTKSAARSFNAGEISAPSSPLAIRNAAAHAAHVLVIVHHQQMHGRQALHRALFPSDPDHSRRCIQLAAHRVPLLHLRASFRELGTTFGREDTY